MLVRINRKIVLLVAVMEDYNVKRFISTKRAFCHLKYSLVSSIDFAGFEINLSSWPIAFDTK